ncbi:MAG: DUF3084 domain-containing protein [bacterium]
MLFGVAIVVLLIVISGLIAYIGDYVGRKVGKRRVSIFNLRPKYTSIIITIITGALIVSVTLSVLFLFSRTARTSFFGLQKIQLELKKGKKELRENKITYNKSVKQLEDKQSELDAILGEINQKALELGEIKQSQEKLAAELNDMDAKAKKLRETKVRLEKEIKATTGRLSEVSVETLYGDLLYKKDELLARATIMPDIPESELRTRLILMINTILEDAVRRGALVDEDTSVIFNEQFKNLKPVLKTTKGALIIEMLAANNVFKGQQMYIKLHPILDKIVYNEGEVIVEQRIPAGMQRGQVDEILSAMLYHTSIQARGKGMLPDPETHRVGAISDKRYLQVVNALTNSADSKIVSIVAFKDTHITDQLRIDFVVK